jgi:UDP-N-acetylmuramoyl-tripeptide--D-alanyl-D-alanine ligase
MNLQLDEITKAVGGTLEGPGNVKVRGYSIDSRTLGAGELFFAVKGPRFDGHAFIKQAAEKKAVGVVIEGGDAESSPTFSVIRVGSTVQALQDLARAVRRRWGQPIVGVTGSAGKTTTKEMIAAVLGKKFTVLRSIGNLNNEFGLPLCLLRVERYQTMGVLEMGMSAKGEIRKLASIAEPNEGVITNVNPVHLEFFDSIDGIAEAKAELLEGLVEPRVGYLNNDDSRVRAMARKFSGKIVTYGVKSVAAFKAQQIQDLGLGGSAFTVHHGRRDVNFVLPLLGTHNVANVLAAIAVGASHDVPWEDMRDAVAAMKPEKMRGQVIKFREGFAAIDDSYNSNPKALTEMIRFLGRLEGYSRKIIVAGEMLELGHESAELHRACGKEAAKIDAALIVGVQGEMRSMLEGAKEAGVEEDRLKFVADAVQAGELLARTVKSGDVVLVKGSRGVKLEQVLNTLRATFASMEP